MTSLVRNTQSKVNCALVTPSQLNCTADSGAQFSLAAQVRAMRRRKPNIKTFEPHAGGLSLVAVTLGTLRFQLAECRRGLAFTLASPRLGENIALSRRRQQTEPINADASECENRRDI